ncbi:hypothetical protein [Algihabitans albus]|uniref:hypothetical protein n=1 Tax=Algihabitans albus TaxID=2164067 RepID=UPI000E5CC844|nr:hypothetical protein [Algihabitans albus]
MTTLPEAAFFTGQITNAQAKAAQDDLLAVVRELPGGSARTTLTIAAGRIVPAAALHLVDTEGQTAADTLERIGTDTHPPGRLLLIAGADPGRAVTVQHDTLAAAEGIDLLDGQDLLLDSLAKWLLLEQRAGRWVELQRAPACGLDLAGAGLRRVSAINQGPLGGFRNLLINPRGQINQRGYVGGAATASPNAYTLDRWRVVVSGQSLSWVDSEGTRTVTAPAGGVEQVIEGASIVTGPYVISWIGSATCTVNGVARANGESFTLTGGSNATVRFSSGSFSLPQLEPGDSPTPFEPRPIATEVTLCQRYYQQYRDLVDRGHNPNTPAGFATICIAFAVSMRATPALGISASTILLSTSVQVDELTLEACTIRSSFSAGQSGDYLLRARLTLDAEL